MVIKNNNKKLVEKELKGTRKGTRRRNYKKEWLAICLTGFPDPEERLLNKASRRLSKAKRGNTKFPVSLTRSKISTSATSW